MIDYKELIEIEDVGRIILENTTELHSIKTRCYELAQKEGIYIEISEDVVSSGGLFSKKTYPCLIIYNPDHRNDYYSFCIMITTDNTRRFADLYMMGSSRLEGKIKYAGKLSQLLHGKQYEIEYRAEKTFYSTVVQEIWDGMKA